MSYKKIQNYINVEGIQTNIDGLTSDLSSLSSSVETIEEIGLTQTTEAQQYFVDGDSGDDANDGLSWATAKKTLLAAWNLVPYVANYTVFIEAKGTFSTTDNGSIIYLNNKLTSYGVNIVISGDWDGQTVIAGPYTADIGDASTVGLSSLTMTPNEYTGYFIEILDGTYAGVRRVIYSHDATTFTPNKNFPGSVNGAQFRIYRPSTTIQPSLSISDVYGQGQFSIQNIYFDFTTTQSIRVYNTVCGTNFRGCMISSPGAASSILSCINANLALQASNVYWDDSVSIKLGARSATTYYLGVGVLSNAIGKKISFHGKESGCFGIGGSIIGNLSFYGTQGNYTSTSIVDNGCRIRGDLFCQDFRQTSNDAYLLYSRSGYAPTQVDGGTIGVSLINSHITFGGNQNIIIKNNTSHGIYLEHACLQMKRVVSGSDNGGFSLLARKNSFVDFSNGQTPTLSGTLGSVSVDGTNPTGSSWADIAAGNKISYAEEFTVVKKAT